MDKRTPWGRVVTRSSITGVITVAVVIALWFFLTSVTGIVGQYRFPSPQDFLASFVRLATEGYAGGTLIEQTLQSLWLVACGFFTAIVIGVPLGFAMGYDRRIEAFLNPVFLLLRPIPPLAWIPLAIVWLGLSDGSKILVIFVAAFVPSVINTFTGVRNVDRTLVEAAKVHGAGTSRLISEVYLPDAAPMIFTGLRLSLQASWTTLVAAELVGAFLGLGRVLSTAYRDINTAMILVAMVVIAIAGAFTTILLAQVEKRVIKWRTT
ncbi:ABC transporter permease [Parasulfitobacter algicola]|uniref:ABC transporter permease n=1 Tax=Parasulfitobacter algicola TaxID=2614809 RepID=A0ABX2ITC6_9RHOB|nr:ABC transporter permease [Sulfitobacter algicola]NSX56163.1 ABC transporter permease [Sulfitobacter algicola]